MVQLNYRWRGGIMLIEKKCSKCKDIKSVLEFHKSKASKDGYKDWCKECRKVETKKYREENKDVILSKKRQWYKDTKKMANARTQSQLELNAKTCSQCNEDKKILEFRERANGGFYSICKQCENSNNKQYRKNNPDKINKIKVHTEQRRRIQSSKLPHDFTVEEWESCLKVFDFKCAYCGVETVDMCQDHFIPLSKEGGYTKTNIIPSCRSCNCQKHNILFDEWYPNFEHYTEERHYKIINYLKDL